MTQFEAQAFQNEYLPAGGTEVHAIVTVRASGAGSSPASGPPAVVVVVDVSGSMNNPRHKIREAKKATQEAIQCIRDGSLFAIVAGSEGAQQVYPPTYGLVAASNATRDEARKAVGRLAASGGTAIGSWLTHARFLFASAPASVRHAIVLTDGRNEDETPDELATAVKSCEGVFQCDCRGVGTDWDVDELRGISSRLLGSVDIVAKADGLSEDFRSMMQHAMSRSTGDVALRVKTPVSARVAFVKQVAPTVEDLTELRTQVDDRTADYPTGAWGNESRDYHICVVVPSEDAGEEMLAARLSLMVGDEVASQATLHAIWTDDEELSTRINPEVAHYTGQEELSRLIDEGRAARDRGDLEEATLKLGKAAQIAFESGHDDTLKLLSHVVDIEDAATGTVRLRSNVSLEDDMTLQTRSTKTVRLKRT